MSFASFAGSLAESLGSNLLEKQKEERERSHEIKKARIQQTKEIMSQPGFQPEHFPGMMDSMLKDLEVDPKVIKQIHEHIGSNDPGAVRQFAEKINPKAVSTQTTPNSSTSSMEGGTGPIQENPQQPGFGERTRVSPQGAPATPAQPPTLGQPPSAPAQYNPFDWKRKQAAILEQQISEMKQKGEVSLEHERQLGGIQQELKFKEKQQEAQLASDFSKRRFQTYMANAGITNEKDIPPAIRQAIAAEAAGVKNPMATLPGMNIVSGAELIARNPEAVDNLQQPVDPGKTYRVIQSRIPGMVDVVVPHEENFKVGPIKPDPNSPTGYSKDRLHPKTGVKVGVDFVQPGQGITGTETSTSSIRPMKVTQGENEVLIPATSTTRTTKTPIRPGGATPVSPVPSGSQVQPTAPALSAPRSTPGTSSSSGTPVGWKPLPPAQKEKLTEQRDAAKHTADAAVSILQNSSVLDHLLSAGMIELSNQDGKLTSVISRGVTLSPQQQEVANNFRFLSEFVNTLRGPSGATGFRGQEAFQKLMGLKGRPLANPETTKGILRLTLGAVLGQIAAKDQAFARSERGPKARPIISPEMAQAYAHMTGGNDPDTAKRRAIEAGYDLPPGVSPPKKK